MKLTKRHKDELDGLFEETILGAIYEDIVPMPFDTDQDDDNDSELAELRKACSEYLIKLLKEYNYDS